MQEESTDPFVLFEFSTVVCVQLKNRVGGGHEIKSLADHGCFSFYRLCKIEGASSKSLDF